LSQHLRLLLTLLLAGGMVAGLDARKTAISKPSSIVVTSGDTLEAISARYGVSLSALIEANGLKDPRQLQVGQRLQLPPPGNVVIIRPGDTLEAIAARHGTSVRQLQAANPAIRPDQLPVGAWLKLAPGSNRAPLQGPATTTRTRPGHGPQVNPTPQGPPEPPRSQAPAVDNAPPAEAALLLSSAERRDRAELALREASGLVQWKRFGGTLVDWNGWRLHPGGVRITLVKPSASDLGARRALATAVAVQCSTVRQTWRIDGAWEPWAAPEPRSVAQRIVLDLCSNTLDGPAVPVTDAPAP
jgi:LysM repeat protein